jgi:hypothetical protein
VVKFMTDSSQPDSAFYETDRHFISRTLSKFVCSSALSTHSGTHSHCLHKIQQKRSETRLNSDIAQFAAA